MACQLSCGGAAVQDDDLIALHHGGGCPADCDLGAGGQLLASCEIHDGGRGGQRATVYALKESFLGEFTEITADGVFGKTEALANIFGHDLAVLFELFEDQLLALFG